VHTGYEQKATGDDRRAHGAGKDQAHVEADEEPGCEVARETLA